jgi:Spy/CpxP family protein refolding chaperone
VPIARLLALAALAVATVASLVSAPDASARFGWDMQVTNHTNVPLSLRAAGEQCWDVQDLGGSGKTVNPRRHRLRSSARSSRSCTSAACGRIG